MDADSTGATGTFTPVLAGYWSESIVSPQNILDIKNNIYVYKTHIHTIHMRIF